MRKIPISQENPIDNILIGICEFVEPIFAMVPGMNPNWITFMSGIAAVTAVPYLRKHRLTPFILLWILSYFLDNLDGYYARQHNMCTEFGSAADHIKDVASYILAFWVIHQTIHVSTKTYLVVAIFFGLSMVHLGTQEMVKKVKTKESSLAPLKSIAYNDIQTTKWVGTGTFVAVFLLAITFSVHTNGWKPVVETAT